jgi:hypothetical protein
MPPDSIECLDIESLYPRVKQSEGTPILRAASPNERASALRALLDVMCKGLSIDYDAVDRLKIEGVAGRMRSTIKAPWLLEDEGPLAATVFIPRPPARRDMRQKDERLIIRGILASGPLRLGNDASRADGKHDAVRGAGPRRTVSLIEQHRQLARSGIKPLSSRPHRSESLLEGAIRSRRERG